MSGISKLVIKAYNDDGFASLKGEFSASINPANLKITSTVDYTTSQGMGSASMALRYNVSPPRTLNFKLLFDNTGIIPDAGINVKDQLERLRNVVYDFQEELSSPYYIRVIWGVIDFKGKLINLDTSYTMFQADGSPIRAEVDITVLEEVDSAGITKALKAQSDAAISEFTPGVTTDMLGGAVVGGMVGATGGALASTAVDKATTDANTGAPGTATQQQAVNEGMVEETSPNATGAPASKTAAAGAAGSNQNAQKSTTNPADNQKKGLAEDTNTSSGTGLKEVKSGDTVPSIAKNALGNPNLSKALGTLNGLNSLRDLLPGLKLAIPFSLAALLAALLAWAKKHAKEGGAYLKKKGQAGKQKAVKGKEKVKEKAKEVKAKH